MLNSLRKLLSQKRAGPIRGLAFFVLFYLYIWLSVDTRLIYHSNKTIINFPIFFRGWAFFKEFISYPGGLVEYLCAFLSQFLYYSWAGALVITLLAWLIYVCTDAFIKAINAPRLRCIRFIPPIFLLIAYTQYTYHFITTVALLTALAFVCLYIRTAPKNKLLGWAVFLVLSVILYTIAGGAYLLFAVLCTLYELLFKRRWLPAVVYPLSALIIPYVEGVFIYDVSIIRAFSDLLPFSRRILSYETCKRMITLIYILYLLLPLTALAVGLWRILVGGAALPPDQPDASKPNPDLIRGKKKGKKKRHSKFSKLVAGILTSYLRNNELRWIIESLVLFVVTGAAVFFFHNNQLKTLLKVNYYTCYRMWPQALQATRRYPNDYLIIHAANRALYHTSRLNYEMFSYSQHPDILLLSTKEYAFARWNRFGTYFDLGIINMAEHELIESTGIRGESPVTLKHLALINMAKGDIGSARIYLGALSKTLFHSQWANDYLDRLESEPNLSTDKEIQRLRGLMMQKDYGFSRYLPETNLLALLEENRQNRMAFEYLMAWYLLTGQLDKFVQNLDRLDDFDYSEIPRYYEEAILIYQVHTGKKVDLKGRKISRSSYQRAHDFGNICNRFQGSGKDWMIQAIRATAENFGDSYLFYYTFGPLKIIK